MLTLQLCPRPRSVLEYRSGHGIALDARHNKDGTVIAAGFIILFELSETLGN